MHTLNLGILAHVDAGKTSLTERLLLHAGVIDRLGRVDAGTTRTDSMELEQQRGITIRSAVAALTLPGSGGDLRVNLVDTPGHPDFIAEVERALAVLDGVVLVVSAVEGVQPQTRILMRALQRLGLPTLVFVNKADRAGADVAATLDAVRSRLSPAVVPMGEIRDEGGPGAAFTAYGQAAAARRAAALLADGDDRLLAALVEDRVPADRMLARQLRRQARAGTVHPVYAGSALTGAGVGALADGLRTLLPRAPEVREVEPSGLVFAVDRGAHGESRAWLRVFAGCVRVRDRVALGERRPRRVTALLDAAGEPTAALAAGQIGAIVGGDGARVGDPLGVPPVADRGRVFRQASLATVVEPTHAADRGRLLAGLRELADQDPLIGFTQDDARDEIALSLFGEVQKEVIAARLLNEYGVATTFAPTSAICVERVTGTGAAHELIAVPPNPYLATVGLRVEPGPEDSGVRFALEVELGSMPPAFFASVREAVAATLRQGLAGWQVVDCVVTMTHSGYWARQSHAHGSFDKAMSSTAGDFRLLTPAVLGRALRRAGTVVCEPVHAFRLDVPDGQLPVVLPELARWEAQVADTAVGDQEVRLTGWIPARRVHEVQVRMPTLTRGEGVFESEPDHHRPVRGRAPARRRTGVDPGDWDRWVRANPR